MKSSLYTPPKENKTTKRPDISNVLTEALDDGTPAYYNSNILGRYYRKDYFDFDASTAASTDAC